MKRLLILKSIEKTELKNSSGEIKPDMTKAADIWSMTARLPFQGGKETRERSGKSPKVIASLKTGSSSPPLIIHNRN